MKKILAVFSGLLIGSALTVHADVIADWTFQTPASTNLLTGTGTSRTSTADIGVGTALGTHASATTAWSIPSGNGSTNSWSANGWAAGDYFQFTVSSLNYTGLGVTYDQTGSATGPKDFQLQYSINAGVSFSAVTGTSNLLASTWSPGTFMPQFNFQYDLSAITGVNNLAALVFRIVDMDTSSINGGTVASGGTDRVDNFTVTGTLEVVPEPTSFALAALGGFSMLGLTMHRRKASK